MRKDNKFINKNYYVSPYPDGQLLRLQRRNVILAFAAAAVFIPIFIIFINPGFKFFIWIYESYEANIAFLLLLAVSFVSIAFCSVFNFFGYRMRREVRQKDAPTLGFRKTGYNGQLFAAVLVSLFAVFVLALFIGYHIADGAGYIDTVISNNRLAGKSGGFDGAGLAALALSLLAAALAWLYYICAYKANKVMQYVRADQGEKEGSGADVTTDGGK